MKTELGRFACPKCGNATGDPNRRKGIVMQYPAAQRHVLLGTDGLRVVMDEDYETDGIEGKETFCCMECGHVWPVGEIKVVVMWDVESRRRVDRQLEEIRKTHVMLVVLPEDLMLGDLRLDGGAIVTLRGRETPVAADRDRVETSWDRNITGSLSSISVPLPRHEPIVVFRQLP